MNRIATLLSACLAAPALIAGAAEPQAKAPITRAALFKNGYALVVREIPAVPGDSFLIDETVTPVHGTLWFAPGDGLHRLRRQTHRDRAEPQPLRRFLRQLRRAAR